MGTYVATPPGPPTAGRRAAVERARGEGRWARAPWGILTAAAGVAVWLIVDPRTPDLAAQVYRANLFREAGFLVWDSRWYGGHDIPGYSLVFPPLGALVGVRAVGAAAVLASATLFERIAVTRVRARRAVGGGVVCAGGAGGCMERANHVCPGGELRAGGGAGVDAPSSTGGGDPRGGVRGVQPGGGRVAGAGGAHAHARRALAAQPAGARRADRRGRGGAGGPVWRGGMGALPAALVPGDRRGDRGVPGGAPGRAAAAVGRRRGVPRGVRGMRGGALPDGRQRGALRGSAGGAAAAVRAA